MKLSNTFLIIFLFMFGSLTAQNKNGPREIKSEKDYIHQKTKVVFPKTLLGFQRVRLVSYDQMGNDVGGSYQLKIGKKVTTMSIYIYPADISSENLRDQFLSFNVAVNKNALNEQVLKPEFVKIKSEKAIVNGIKTFFDYNLMIPDFMKGQKEQINKSMFSVYDCGKWNIKFRITSESYDEFRLNHVEKLLLALFNPLKIAEENSLEEGGAPKIIISKTAQRDSLMVKSTIAEADSKVEWLNKNKSVAELSTGLSDFDLEAHEYAIMEKLKFYNENKANLAESFATNEYFTGLQKIYDNGYLKDFIYSQTFGVVDFPEGESRSIAYKNFLTTNNISEDVRELMYKIYY